ncbi:MAG: hypothetical protein J0L99_09680 [Chitinophagales bacterium]|nr:hypothetical protein [Chitinophagales bacterium]
MARKVNVSIEIDGRNIAPIAHLSLQQPLNGHHSLELRCPIQERDRLLFNAGDYCGKEIKIEINAGSGRAGIKNLFKGFITGVSLSKTQGGSNEVIYYGNSPSVMMDDGPHNQSFAEKNLDKIVKEITSKYNISAKSAASNTSGIPYVTQYRESSFRFISRLANQYGEWFFYDGQQLIFGKAPSDSPIELVFGRDLFNFDLALNLMPTKFKWQAYNPLNHKYPESASASAKITGMDDYGKKILTASENFFSNETSITTPFEVQDKSELEALVLHNRSAKAGNIVICNGSSDNFVLKTGSIISIKGSIGDALNAPKDITYGDFRIINITHSTDSLGNYQNHFKAIPAGLGEPPVNPFVTLPICEPQQAEVLENHDPEGMGRVRVQFPWQKSNNEKTPWIRQAAPGSGGGYGYYYVPEKGDQVFIAFEHNNPDKPYVLGGLYHGKAKPKDASDADNNKKILQTKSGNKILLDDSGTIEIISGANTIILTKGKITIKTDGDFELSAKNIKLDASENLTLLGATVSLEGNDTTLSGKTTNTVKSPSMTIEGETTISMSGGIIDITAQTIANIKANAMLNLNS